MRNKSFTKALVTVVSLCNVYLPVGLYVSPALAANPYSSEIEGFSKSITDNVWRDAEYSDGQIRMGSIEGEMSEIFPGLNDSNAAPVEAPGYDTVAGSYGDDDAMNDLGAESKGILYDDAVRDEHIKADPATVSNPDQLPWSDSSVSQAQSTKYGVAYDIIREDAERPGVDLTNDPIFDSVRDAKEDASIFEENFFECSEEDVLVDNSRDVHVPDYKTCNRIKTSDNSCEIIHDYTAAVVSHHAGPFNLKKCPNGDCQELWIGKVGDNYWSGWCDIFTQSTQIKVKNPDAIEKAVLSYAKWDDYMQVLIGPPGQEELVWSGPNGNFPPETAGKCELSESWSRNPNLDVTRHFKNVEPGTVISFKIRVSVSGEGEGYGKIRIDYDPDKVLMNDQWTPESCFESAQAIDDSFASGSYSCVDDPGLSDPDGCAVIDGIPVCPDMLKDPPIDNISKTCRKVEVEADFDFYQGQMECWTDPQGNEHCPTIDSEFESTCQDLEKQGCGFISQDCVGNATGKSGTCYLTEEVWDCGESVSIESSGVETQYSCDGDFQCIGPDCFDTTVQPNTDFAKVSALLNMAQNAQQDLECVGQESTEQNVTCTVFSGDNMECKTAVGGAQDCCDQPVGVSVRDYLQMVMAVPKVDAAIMGAELASGSMMGAAQSGYMSLRNPAVEAVQSVTEPFVNHIDSAVNAIKEPVEKALADLVAQLKEQAAALTEKIVGSIGGEQAGQAAGQVVAGEVGGGAVSNAAMSFAQTLYGIYAYYALAMAIIQIVWQCEEEEFMLSAQEEFGNCTYIGSYCKTEVLGVCIEKRKASCCFKSPMARIMQEQVRGQLGMSWGDPENPQCGGIPLEDISRVDWDKVNLDEWTAILQKNGLYQGDSTNLTMDALTGTGSYLGGDLTTGQERLDVEERTEMRGEGIEFDKRKIEARDNYSIDVH